MGHLALISMATILPDLMDKTLTGSRYPFHSLIVLGIVLLSLNIVVRLYFSSNKSYASKYSFIPQYLSLVTFVILIHPIFDLEGLVPLFYPIDLRGYQLDFQITILQSIPPIISHFNIGFVIKSYNYFPYGNEGDLINTFDVLFVATIFFVLVIKGLENVKISLKTNNNKQD
jgi:hypothetical protein